MVYTIEEYSNMQHRIYNRIKVYAASGNVYHIYKEHIREYDGIYKKEYGIQFVLKHPNDGFSITRTKKQSIINYLIRNYQL